MEERSETDDVEISTDHDHAFFEETDHLLRIFPEEIWISILDKLTNLDDLENCSNATPYFNHLLSDRKAIFLFPKVLESLIPRYFKDGDIADSSYREDASLVEVEINYPCVDVTVHDADLNSSDEENSNRVLKLDYPHKLTAVWKLRLVCTAWNNAVENFFQSSSAGHLTLDYDLKLGEVHAIRRHATDRLNYYLPRTPSLFLEYFQETHYSEDLNCPLKNPFTGRSLHLPYHRYGLTSSPAGEDFLTGMCSLLLNFGREVWYLSVSVNVQACSEMQLEFYLRLKKWLEFMPNLKMVEISYSESYNFDGDVINTMELQYLLVEGIARNPLPNLENLQLLKIKHLPAIMFNALLKRNHHISGLDLKVKAEDIHGDKYDLYSVPLPNLKLLSTTNIQELEESIVANWPLERFYSLRDHGTDFLEGFQVFNLLKLKWADTLTNLVIQLPYPNTDAHKKTLLEKTNSVRLNLPYLRRLHLSVTDPICLDFLLPCCKSLEHIEVIAYCSHEDIDRSSIPDYYSHMTQKQIVEYLGFEHKILESNVWKIFGRLKQFRISVWDYDEGFKSKVYNRSNLSP